MINLVFVALLQTGVLAAEPAKAQPLSYAEAYQASQADDKPLVILVGADWCPACVKMKNSAIPQIAQNEVFQNVAFTVVDTDRQSDIARQVMEGGSIPQLVMFHKTADGWQRERLTGGQSPSAIISFLRRGVAAAGRIVR